uniref:Tc1-like transposase DDE domain-containing protein n=1 Tax=Sinocyclocheilus anshuiensis TaxID=1608454 RepID=A0A671SMV4_9TELE
MATVFLASDGHCQQHNVTCHTARTVKEWFEEHDGEFLLMLWPPNSPDMNPIEKQVCATSPPPHNVWELEHLLLILWCPRRPFQSFAKSCFAK